MRTLTGKRLALWTLAVLGTLCFVLALISSSGRAPAWLPWSSAAAGTATFIWLFTLMNRHQRSLAGAVTAGRPPLTAQEFATTHFSGDAVPIATRCRELFEQYYWLDASRVHPDDRLYEDLRFAMDDGMQADDFAAAIRDEFGVTFSAAEASQMFTLRDIVQGILRERHVEV